MLKCERGELVSGDGGPPPVCVKKGQEAKIESVITSSLTMQTATVEEAEAIEASSSTVGPMISEQVSAGLGGVPVEVTGFETSGRRLQDSPGLTVDFEATPTDDVSVDDITGAVENLAEGGEATASLLDGISASLADLGIPVFFCHKRMKINKEKVDVVFFTS
jgi:hypothetical protein